MEGRDPLAAFPWSTLYISILVPLITYFYSQLPAPMMKGIALWLTSPFNIYYELQNLNGFFYNYVLVVFVFLFVELYTRNLADLKGRVSLMRNAGLFSVLSSYLVSAIIWSGTGTPSSGTSIIAFNVLIFAAFETYDSELIRRMSERRRGVRGTVEILSLVFVALLLIVSTILFVYLNKNTYWYVHIAGGAIFAPMYYIYLTQWVRPRLDMFEEKIEEDVEEDLEKAGEEVEEEAEKVEEKIKKGLKRKSRKPSSSS